MTDRPDIPATGDDFDALLRARRRLLPRFEDPHTEDPSPELDRLVLARARDALRLESPPERHYRAPRWATPLALAATVLLSIGLVTQLDPTRNDAVLSTDRATDATAEPAASAPVAQAAGSAGDASMMEADGAVPASPERRARQTEEFVADAPREAGRDAERKASPLRAAPKAAAEIESVSTASAAAASRPATPPAAPLAASGAPGDAAVSLRAESMRATAAASDSAADAPTAAQPRAAIARDDPERWLDAIEQLQRAGDLATVRVELAEFRRAHPDRPLPDSLERLLR